MHVVLRLRGGMYHETSGRSGFELLDPKNVYSRVKSQSELDWETLEQLESEISVLERQTADAAKSPMPPRARSERVKLARKLCMLGFVLILAVLESWLSWDVIVP